MYWYLKKITLSILIACFLISTGFAGGTQSNHNNHSNLVEFNTIENYIHKHWKNLTRHWSKSQKNLLYLPYPYVVPGGMFNEMYGWDSYFIIKGLIKSGELNLAEGMLENYFYEIKHYGKILNGNRNYYLTRSQPPFLTSAIFEIYYHKTKNMQENQRRTWLNRAYNYAKKDYAFWTNNYHLAGKTGLSRYFDTADGPVMELEHTNYYQDAVNYFLDHPKLANEYLVESNSKNAIGKIYPVCVYDNQRKCKSMRKVSLSKAFYKGDRALRESGLDITFRFGPYGVKTIDFAPVDLNSLLYKMEKDLELMSRILNKNIEAKEWNQKALHRKKIMNKYFWNAAKGLFFDYDFKSHTQSDYIYASTFMPLWAGLATPEQANSIRNNLKLFEVKGGIVASPYFSGAQWDYPYGWPPQQLLAIEALKKYGYKHAAKRLSMAFLTTVTKNFKKDGTIREKYNVVTGSSEVHINVGYKSNEIGFGWTNGVVLSLLKDEETH